MGVDRAATDSVMGSGYDRRDDVEENGCEDAMVAEVQASRFAQARENEEQVHGKMLTDVGRITHECCEERYQDPGTLRSDARDEGKGYGLLKKVFPPSLHRSRARGRACS